MPKVAGDKAEIDDLNEIIERHIDRLRDSVELKLMKEMDVSLKNRFETTGRILGWAFGAVALILAGFGIKTVSDVKEVSKQTAIEQVKKTLSIDDPNSEFRRDIDKVVARGLIDSYLLAIAQNKHQRFNRHIGVSETDLRRLTNLISDPTVDIKDFDDACEVLFKSDSYREKPALQALFRGGFHNSRASRPATRSMHAVWSRAWTMKPSRS